MPNAIVQFLLSLWTDQRAVPAVTQYLSYDGLTFLADVGSYLGLLVGAGIPRLLGGVLDGVGRLHASAKI